MGSRVRAVLGVIVFIACHLHLNTGSYAATLSISPATLEKAGLDLTGYLATVQPGDEIILMDGAYKGPVTIDIPLVLRGANSGATIDAGGMSSVISINAADVTVQGLILKNSGISHETKDSGVFLNKTAKRAVVRDNVLINNLVGVYVWGADDAQVIHNSITGRNDLRVNERGNGVYIWNAPGAYVGFNDIQYGRDGIFINTSKKNTFEGNRLRDLRYGIHYMYANFSTVKDNISIGNDAGFALMFSRQLSVTGNTSIGGKVHGFLLNYANSSDISDNKVIGHGGEKCVFIYNSNKNTFHRNWFEDCDIGVHFTGGSERNEMLQNSFMRSRTQVKYVGTRWVEWSDGEKGNFWSDNAAYDLNGDHIADDAYRPNDLVDQVMWRHPVARTLLSSPAVQILRWAQGQFPGVYPGGVIDRHPLMTPTPPQISSYWQDKE